MDIVTSARTHTERLMATGSSGQAGRWQVGGCGEKLCLNRHSGPIYVITGPPFVIAGLDPVIHAAW